MTPAEDAWLRRILEQKAERVAYIDEQATTHNRCAWDGVARVSPGQAFCVTHEIIGFSVWHDMESVAGPA